MLTGEGRGEGTCPRNTAAKCRHREFATGLQRTLRMKVGRPHRFVGCSSALNCTTFRCLEAVQFQAELHPTVPNDFKHFENTFFLALATQSIVTRVRIFGRKHGLLRKGSQ